MDVLTDRVTADKLVFASNMLKVISHPVRLAIVDALHQQKKMTVLEFQEKLGLDQPIASQHLTLMQDKGVLVSEKVGRNRFFTLKYPDMYKIINCLENCCNAI